MVKLSEEKTSVNFQGNMTRPRRPPRWYECNPVTKLWRPPVEETQFCRPRSGFGARLGFCKTKQKLIMSMKPTSNLNNFQPLMFHTIPRLLINIIFFGLTKNGHQNRSSGAKLCYFDGRAPQLSARVTLVPSGASVVCHIMTYILRK